MLIDFGLPENGKTLRIASTVSGLASRLKYENTFLPCRRIALGAGLNGVFKAAQAQAGGRGRNRFPGRQRDGLEHLKIFFGSQSCPDAVAIRRMQKGMEELGGRGRVFLMRSRMTLWSERRRRLAGF